MDTKPLGSWSTLQIRIRWWLVAIMQVGAGRTRQAPRPKYTPTLRKLITKINQKCGPHSVVWAFLQGDIMAEASKFVRCEPDDPNRCQASSKTQQCPFLAVPGSKGCPMHGGHWALRKEETARKRLYNLAKYQDRIAEHANHDQAKSLREEIGILRILLEGVMDKCQDQTDLLMYSNKISDLAIKIEKLVSSCHRLEEKTGMLLDKHAALQIATQVVAIIGDYINDENIMEVIAHRIAEVILGTKPETT